MEFLEVTHRSNYYIGTYENVVLLYWINVASADAVEHMRTAFGRAKEASKPILFVTYMEDQSASREIPDDFRNAFALLLNEVGPKIAAGALVYERPGFKGAMIRAVVSAINLAGRIKFPTKVHASLEEGMQWLLATGNEKAFDTDSLTHAIRAVSAQVNASSRVEAGFRKSS